MVFEKAAVMDVLKVVEKEPLKVVCSVVCQVALTVFRQASLLVENAVFELDFLQVALLDAQLGTETVAQKEQKKANGLADWLADTLVYISAASKVSSQVDWKGK